MKTTERRLELKDWYFMPDQADFGEEAGFQNPEYDHSGWLKVQAYTSWETYDDSLFDYEGYGWFYTEFIAFDDTEKALKLHFDGAGGKTKVFVNGQFAGGDYNRYLPYDVDITPFVKYGEKNCIAVKVDNRPGSIQHLTGGTGRGADRVLKIEWVLYGGLTHHIYVVEEAPVRVEKMQIRADYDGTARIALTVANHGKKSYSGTLTFGIEGLEGISGSREITLAPGAEETVKTVLKAENAKTWSPEEPNLYTFEAVLSADGCVTEKASDRIGFRTIGVQGTKILLNGKNYFLKGANRYDEFAPYGICPPAEKIREDLMNMKAAGMNIVRTHYPQDEIHYEIADEIGIMYMIEVPLNWWRPMPEETMEDYPTLAWEAEDTLHRIFANFCNHPCWTVWSVGNECDHSVPTAQVMFRRLAALMREYDFGRLITLALNMPILNSKELDFCDFIAVNYYACSTTNTAGARRASLPVNFRKRYEFERSCYPDKPFVLTEFGACSIIGLHGKAEEGRFSEEFHALYLEDICAEFALGGEQLCGLIIWCWADYRHRRGFYPSSQGPIKGMSIASTYGPYGVVTMDRRAKKVPLETLKKIYDRF